jgi:hypothetical protein
MVLSHPWKAVLTRLVLEVSKAFLQFPTDFLLSLTMAPLDRGEETGFSGVAAINIRDDRGGSNPEIGA